LARLPRPRRRIFPWTCLLAAFSDLCHADVGMTVDGDVGSPTGRNRRHSRFPCLLSYELIPRRPPGCTVPLSQRGAGSRMSTFLSRTWVRGGQEASKFSSSDWAPPSETSPPLPFSSLGRRLTLFPARAQGTLLHCNYSI
jgi:hypothetical protein